MNNATTSSALPQRLAALLQSPGTRAAGMAPLPLPGAGRTLQRWQALADVAAQDLVLAKLFEQHTDALAILSELGTTPPAEARVWAVWAAEPPSARVTVERIGSDRAVQLNGSKQWCSGADLATHALVTAWEADGSGPWLVQVDMADSGIAHDPRPWQAVGMAGCVSGDLVFTHVPGRLVGNLGDYVARPGFMHGGAGLAACWWGGALALATVLRRAVAATPKEPLPFRQAALGRVDLALAQTAALLRETAAWIDAHPRDDASVQALRVRQSADACARLVLDEVGRALGATPFCRDAAFARMAADLPVFVRQNLAERDLQALGRRIAAEPRHGWHLLLPPAAAAQAPTAATTPLAVAGGGSSGPVQLHAVVPVSPPAAPTTASPAPSASPEPIAAAGGHAAPASLTPLMPLPPPAPARSS